MSTNWHICDYCDKPIPDGDFDFVTTIKIDIFPIIVMKLSCTVTLILWHYGDWHIHDYWGKYVTLGDFDFVTTMMIDTFVIIVMNLPLTVTLILRLL